MNGKAITVHTEGLNRYNYRVLTAGMKTVGFEKNPVMYFGHMMFGLPIGTWAEFTKHDNGDITAVPMFDEITELSATCKKMYDAGTLRAASIHVDPIKCSSEPSLLLDGQQCETVIESDLLEISIVGVPGNADATRMLSAFSTKPIPGILPNVSLKMDYKKINAALGITDSAGEAEIVSAIQTLLSENSQMRSDSISTALSAGRANGLVNDNNEPQWRALAAKDYQSTLALLSAAPPTAGNPAPAAQVPPPAVEKPVLLTGMLSAGRGGNEKKNDGREDWSLDDWSKKDTKGLSAMRKNDPERYQALAEAKYQNA